MDDLLYTRISDKICEYITEHDLEIGEKLPSERVLSGMLKVSRTSVREAIRDLEKQGVLKVEAGRGSFIVGDIMDRSMMIKIKKHNFFDLFEIKAVLEEHIIRALVPKLSEETLKFLEMVAVQMVSLAKTGIFPQELDDVFHKTLLESYWNKEMVEVVENIMVSFTSYNNTYFNRGIGIIGSKNQSILDTIPPHLDMVECMKNKDADGAVEMYRKIIDLDTEIYSLIQE